MIAQQQLRQPREPQGTNFVSAPLQLKRKEEGGEQKEHVLPAAKP